MKYLFFLIIFLFSLNIFSQIRKNDKPYVIDSVEVYRDRVAYGGAFNNKSLFAMYKRIMYIDESFKLIDSISFVNKCKNHMRKCTEIANKDTLILAVQKRFQFGKLSKYANKRIHNEIYRNKKFNGTIIIHYSHKLKSLDDVYMQTVNNRKVKELIYRKKFKKNKTISIRKEDIVKKGRKIEKRVNKCINKYKKKFNVDVLHYYYEGTTDYTPEINWVKDKNLIIKNYFFKYIKQFYYVIIKPDGEYLLIGGLITPKKIKKILKNDDWSKYKEDLKKSESAREGVGFFNMQHIHNCL